jgi:hypothetical protein
LSHLFDHVAIRWWLELEQHCQYEKDARPRDEQGCPLPSRLPLRTSRDISTPARPGNHVESRLNRSIFMMWRSNGGKSWSRVTNGKSHHEYMLDTIVNLDLLQLPQPVFRHGLAKIHLESTNEPNPLLDDERSAGCTTWSRVTNGKSHDWHMLDTIINLDLLQLHQPVFRPRTNGVSRDF